MERRAEKPVFRLTNEETLLPKKQFKDVICASRF
jgi:hypothetical protein